MSDSIISFGIIGHGFMGHTHEKMLTRTEGVKVAAVADINPSRLEDVREGIKKYTDPGALINDPDVRVVLIGIDKTTGYAGET